MHEIKHNIKFRFMEPVHWNTDNQIIYGNRNKYFFTKNNFSNHTCSIEVFQIWLNSHEMQLPQLHCISAVDVTFYTIIQDDDKSLYNIYEIIDKYYLNHSCVPIY